MQNVGAAGSRAFEKGKVKIELVADALALAGAVRLRVTGASMLPTIWPGDVLVVKCRGFDELKAGDIAVFERDRRLVTHRVIQKNRESLIAQGDAKPEPDPPFHRGDVFGAVVAVRRGGREVSVALRKTATGQLLRSALRSSQLLTRIAVHLNSAVHRLMEMTRPTEKIV